MRALKSDFLFHSRFGMLGSIDSNTGSPDLGWDTDQFPMDVRDTTLVMKVYFNLYYSTEVNSQLLNPQLNVHFIKTHICFSQKSINKSPSVNCISDFHWYFLGCPYFGLIKNFQANNYIQFRRLFVPTFKSSETNGGVAFPATHGGDFGCYRETPRLVIIRAFFPPSKETHCIESS